MAGSGPGRRHAAEPFIAPTRAQSHDPRVKNLPGPRRHEDTKKKKIFFFVFLFVLSRFRGRGRFFDVRIVGERDLV